MFEDVAELVVHETGFLVVGELDVQHVGHFFFQVGIEYGCYCLDATVEVAPHPVGRTTKDFRITVITEIPYTCMLQEGVDDAGDSDVSAIGLSRYQTADTPDDQVYFYSALRGFIQTVDHMGILQAVHLQYNSAFPSLFRQLYFMIDQTVQFGYQVETGYEQRTEFRIFLFPL